MILPAPTVAQALREAAAALAQISDTARLDAELLMAAALDLPRSAMLLQARDLTAPDAFAKMVARRMKGEPTAYIVGKQDFYGRTFIVDPDVLIPRADSETVIEAAVGRCREGAQILDLGTGSGALLLTLLAETRDTHGIGIDAAPGALAIARANAAQFDLSDRTRMLERDWTRAGWRGGLGTFDMIVANPPYVAAGAPLDAMVRDHEPAAALFAGPDGLDDYRIIIPQLRGLMTATGTAALEIGHDQEETVSALARQSGFAVTLRRDLAQRPRVLILQ